MESHTGKPHLFVVFSCLPVNRSVLCSLIVSLLSFFSLFYHFVWSNKQTSSFYPDNRSWYWLFAVSLLEVCLLIVFHSFICLPIDSSSSRHRRLYCNSCCHNKCWEKTLCVLREDPRQVFFNTSSHISSGKQHFIPFFVKLHRHHHHNHGSMFRFILLHPSTA